MDVRDDGDAHGRTLAKALGLAALAAAWVGAAAVLWRTEVPDLSPPASTRVSSSRPSSSTGSDYRSVSGSFSWARSQPRSRCSRLWQARPLSARLERVGRGRVRTSVLVGLVVVAAVSRAAVLGSDARPPSGLRALGAELGGWLADQLTSLAVQAVLVSIGSPARSGWPGASAAGGGSRAPRRWSRSPRSSSSCSPSSCSRSSTASSRCPTGSSTPRSTSWRVSSASKSTSPRRRCEPPHDHGERLRRRARPHPPGRPLRHAARRALQRRRDPLRGCARARACRASSPVERACLVRSPGGSGVFLLARLTDRLGGLGPRLVPLGLAFAFAWILVTQPLANAVSRRYEAEADWLALQATRDPPSGVALDRSFVRTVLRTRTRPRG